jgi:hypothetical protein
VELTTAAATTLALVTYNAVHPPLLLGATEIAGMVSFTGARRERKGGIEKIRF